MQDCSNSIALAMELLQSGSKPWVWCFYKTTPVQLTMKSLMRSCWKLIGLSALPCGTPDGSKHTLMASDKSLIQSYSYIQEGWKGLASVFGIMMTSSKETFSVLLALCVGNSPVTCEFTSKRPVTWSFDVFFDLRLNKRLSKQSRGWWFEMPLCSLWCHCNAMCVWGVCVCVCVWGGGGGGGVRLLWNI